MTNRIDPIQSALADPSLNTYQSNRALNALLDSMREIVLYFDQWGVIRHANARAHEWRAGDHLVGKTFVEVAPAWDDPAERQREIMQVFRTRTPCLESRERALEAGFQAFISKPVDPAELLKRITDMAFNEGEHAA